jgi:hypothetical protein
MHALLHLFFWTFWEAERDASLMSSGHWPYEEEKGGLFLSKMLEACHIHVGGDSSWLDKA